MRIGADNQVPRKHQSLLGQDHMLDAHLADLKIDQSLADGEITHHLDLLGGGDILVGHEMVRHHDHFLRIENPLQPDPLELPDGYGRGDVIR